MCCPISISALALANLTGRIGFASQIGYPDSMVFADYTVEGRV